MWIICAYGKLVSLFLSMVSYLIAIAQYNQMINTED